MCFDARALIRTGPGFVSGFVCFVCDNELLVRTRSCMTEPSGMERLGAIIEDLTITRLPIFTSSPRIAGPTIIAFSPMRTLPVMSTSPKNLALGAILQELLLCRVPRTGCNERCEAVSKCSIPVSVSRSITLPPMLRQFHWNERREQAFRNSLKSSGNVPSTSKSVSTASRTKT